MVTQSEDAAEDGPHHDDAAGHLLGGLFEGFEAYRTPSESDYHHVLTNGLVVPDTNVLLNLYRYRTETRDDLFSVLHRLGQHLWVPNQVVVEFWRNREKVLEDPRDAEETVQKLTKNRDGAIGTFRGWANRVGLPTERTVELTDTLARSFSTIIAEVGELTDDEAVEAARNTNRDPVLAKLEQILEGRVGAEFDDTMHQTALEEAKRRAESREPPGYMDYGKEKEKPAGDYLIWAQALDEARRREVDVLIVTGDVKEDWWRKEHGELRGPRHELIKEMRAVAGVRLLMLRPESLMLYARQALQVEVRDESVEDVERVDKFLADTENGGWEARTLRKLLAKLAAEGWTAQAAVIQQAANNGGFADRDVVYEVGRYESTRSLRGFTRPITRIVQEFREQGVVPESAIEVLSTEYDPESSNPGWASGFSVPKDLIPLIRELSTDTARENNGDVPQPRSLD